AVGLGYVPRPPAVSSRRHIVPPNVTPVYPEQGAMDRGQEGRTDGRSDPTPGRSTWPTRRPRPAGHVASPATPLRRTVDEDALAALPACTRTHRAPAGDHSAHPGWRHHARRVC